MVILRSQLKPDPLGGFQKAIVPMNVRHLSLSLTIALSTGCVAGSATLPPLPTALPVFLAVTNESGVQRRIELLVNDVVVLDTVVGRPINLTGRVLADTVRLGAGKHDIRFVDHLHKKVHRSQLVTKPGEMFIAIQLLSGARTTLRTGHGRFLFM